ncbi:MAG: hypothetical protein LBV74_09760 [Tannerella sp.]|jgi:hypothetical protein|nr:hypothetical protein [Tannerella sp.]
MVEYKAYLKLKIPQEDNIMGLSWERYRVIDCNYEFYKKTNRAGEVVSGVKGGEINLTLSDLPTDELMAWVFDHFKKYNGEVTIMDTDETTLEQVYFENARCIDFRMRYGGLERPHIKTYLKLSVGNMKIGDVLFDNVNK